MLSRPNELAEAREYFIIAAASNFNHRAILERQAPGAAAGQIEMSYPSVVSVGPLLESGKLRAIAVTGPKRAASLPSIPTINEAGLTGYERSTWFGIAAPGGVAKDIVARLNAVIVKIGATAEMKATLSKQGLESETGTPAAPTQPIYAPNRSPRHPAWDLAPRIPWPAPGGALG